jgi:HAE1 family hydrophobic/amphiphilic exporter-1
LKLYVKNDRDEMVPYSAFMKLEKLYGLSGTRHNMYTSTEISGSAAQDIVVVQLLKLFKKSLQKKLPGR